MTPIEKLAYIITHGVKVGSSVVYSVEVQKGKSKMDTYVVKYKEN